MKVLIIEDEPPIADFIEETAQQVLGSELTSISKVHTVERALLFLSEHSIDVCLLDLNLNGKDGYDLLQHSVAGSFHTIIISAYTDQAVHAFEYGVLDFVPKPFDAERLQKAFDRYFNLSYRHDLAIRYLTVKDQSGIRVLDVNRFKYFMGADNYVEGYMTDGHMELLDKPIYRLIQILPHRFVQIHRSCIADIEHVKSFGHAGQGKYNLTLDSGEILPLSRSKYKALQKHFEVNPGIL